MIVFKALEIKLTRDRNLRTVSKSEKKFSKRSSRSKVTEYRMLTEAYAA